MDYSVLLNSDKYSGIMKTVKKNKKIGVNVVI